MHFCGFVLSNVKECKASVHLKMKIMPSCTHPHIVSNLHDFLSVVEHKLTLFIRWSPKQYWTHCTKSLNSFFFVWQKEIHTRFEATCGWVNDDRLLIWGGNCPFNKNEGDWRTAEIKTKKKSCEDPPVFPPQERFLGPTGCWWRWCNSELYCCSHCCCPAATRAQRDLNQSHERERESRKRTVREEEGRMMCDYSQSTCRGTEKGAIIHAHNIDKRAQHVKKNILTL